MVTTVEAVLIVIASPGVQFTRGNHAVEPFSLDIFRWHCQRMFCLRGMAHVENVEVTVLVLLPKDVYHPFLFQSAKNIWSCRKVL